MNTLYNSDKVEFFYQSMKVPMRAYSYDIGSREKVILADVLVGGGYKPENYKVERILIKVRDGTLVPVSLIFKNGMKKDGKSPLFLNAYGSYGFPFPLNHGPAYSLETVLPLLNRGMIVAIAHVRGGGEFGLKWYHDGKLLKKKNTFYDFIDVSEALIKLRYSQSDRMAMRGVSAGGLLTGFVVNQRPDLFHAIIANVPFVDILNTELNDKIPLTTQEWEEWGNPNRKKDYFYIKSYCPYTNIGKHLYPHLLVKTGLKDTQVLVHEPAKYVAKIRRNKTDANDLLLQVNMKAGHGGKSGQYAELEELAFDFSWLLSKLGVP